MNNFNIMGVHQFLGDGGHNNIKGELPRKGSLDNLQEAWLKEREEGVFEGRGGGVDTSMHTMT